MRIGINAFPLRVEFGGARYVFAALLRALLDRNDPADQYLIFATPSESAFIGGLIADSPHARFQPVADEAKILAHRDRFDLYFCPLSYAAPRLYDRPVVAILHDAQEQYFPRYFSPTELLRRREDHPDLCRSATTLITVSEFCKHSFVEGFAADPARIEVIPNAPQADLLTRAPAWKRSALPANFLLYPAATYPHKNHALLLQLVERDAQTSIVFVGPDIVGGYPLRREIERRRLKGRGLYFNRLAPEELAYLYQHAFATVLPSLFEGFGMPVVEAMAMGCPLVCSDLPALREVAGDAALYFPSNDLKLLAGQLCRLNDEFGLRDHLAAAGRVAATRFSWPNAAERLHRVFTAASGIFSGARRCRIGILTAGIPDAQRMRLQAQGFTVDQLGRPVTLADLIEFGRRENLDLVGQILLHNQLTSTAADSLSHAYHENPSQAAYLGEVLETRKGQPLRTIHLRRTGDNLWKLDGYFYPEMLFLNPRHPAVLSTRDTSLWPLLRQLRQNGQLQILRRTLAICDRRSVSWGSRIKAWRQGMYAFYRPTDESRQPMPLVRHVESAARALSRRLPTRLQDLGAEIWGRLAG